MTIIKEATIVICTYNRLPFLERCVSSLISEIEKDSSLLKKTNILIVLNNCSDDTLSFCQSIKAEYPFINYVLEPNQGLSYARNTGTLFCQSPWVIFLDDDGIPRKDFIKIALETIASNKYDCFGGTYYPIFETDYLPKWLPQNFGSNKKAYTSSVILPTNEFASGGILAIKKEVITKLGMFDPALGCHGRIRKVGEETYLQMKMRESGFIVGFNPKWEMDHYTPNSKLTVKWLIEREFHDREFYKYITGKNRFTNIQRFLGVIKSILKIFLRREYRVQNLIIDISKFIMG